MRVLDDGKGSPREDPKETKRINFRFSLFLMKKFCINFSLFKRAHLPPLPRTLNEEAPRHLKPAILAVF